MEGASSRAEGAREQASRPGQAAPGERLPAAAAPDVSAPAVPAPALPAAGDPTESGTLRRAKARAAKASPGAPPAPGAGESAPRGRRSRGRAAPRRDSPGARARPRSGRGLPADGMALLERVRGLTLRLSADVASRTLTVGELLAVRPGSVIDLAKAVTEPLELRAAGRLVALGDAVSLPGGPAGRGSLPAGGSPRGGFGLKVRGG